MEIIICSLWGTSWCYDAFPALNVKSRIIFCESLFKVGREFLGKIREQNHNPKVLKAPRCFRAATFCMVTLNICESLCEYGPSSSGGIATKLRAGRSRDRIPVGTRFFAPVQTGHGAHPASCVMGTGSFPGVKYGRGVLLTTYFLLRLWSWKSKAKPLPTLGHTGPVTGLLYLYFYPLFESYCIWRFWHQ
jgi:hypothetical protein